MDDRFRMPGSIDCLRFAWLALPFLCAPLALLADEALDPLGWYIVQKRGPTVARAPIEAAREALDDLRVRWIDDRSLRDALREADRRKGVLDEAGEHLKKGRELHLGLKMDAAMANYRQAISALESGFVRYYEPERLAEPLLQLGVALHQTGQEDEARKAFMRSVALSPGLELAEGYYAPSVREAFSRARQALGPLQAGTPEPSELARMCGSAQLKGLVVVSIERMGGSSVLRLGLFDAGRGGFVAVETAMLGGAEADEQARKSARRIGKAIRAMLGLALLQPQPQPESPDGGTQADGDGDAPLGGDLSGPDAGEDGSPWYAEHWWIWPVAAAVVGAAVAVPLIVLREDVVDVHVRD
ncbi:MAG: tetratricopeptide repeat protein [Deltaproteobacteria bacterium]|nr:tetratricopeptide repeat protein [Deltaproteobacteria bacterium]